MKALTVGETKSAFSDILTAVQRGERFAVSYGRKRKPVAMIVPYEGKQANRELGMLSGCGRYTWHDGGPITDEELLQS